MSEIWTIEQRAWFRRMIDDIVGRLSPTQLERLRAEVDKEVFDVYIVYRSIGFRLADIRPTQQPKPGVSDE